jgi:hypothetical protein
MTVHTADTGIIAVRGIRDMTIKAFYGKAWTG